MKKTYVILTLALIFYCTNASYSQKTVSLKTTSSDGYNLNKHSKIDVISNLPDSNNLGYLASDVINDRKYIKSSGAITEWIQNFVDKQFVSSPDTNAKALLWVIQDLNMGKDSTQKQAYSFVKLKADIIKLRISKYIRQYYHQ